MSWVKNLWHRVFHTEVEEHETEQIQETRPATGNRPAPFRFPLISDEEKQSFLSGQDFPEEPAQPLPPAYAPEPFREVRPARRERPAVKAEERYVPKQPVKKTSTRRFEPTRVPSPVYGYGENRLATQPVHTTTEKPAESSRFELAEQQAALQDVHAKEEVKEAPQEEEQAITASKESAAEPKQEPAEKPAVATEEIKLEAAREEPTKNREKTVPFNVLMLKSDKQKLQRRTSAPQPAEVGRQEQPAQPAAEPERNKERPAQPAKAERTEAPQTDLVKASEPNRGYSLPETAYLRPPEDEGVDSEWMEEQGDRLIEALSHFHITAEVTSIVQGPAVTQFELTVAHGVKVSKIRNLADDLKLALAARDIRIQAPIPGKSSIGIEIPNRSSRPVRISEIINSDAFKQSDSPMEAALGLDLTGKPVSVDLRKMPHGLIAGATGSGKSVCINSLLVSLLYKSAPRDLKLLLIDPKMVELAPYNHIPHLLSPVITDVKAATASLKWAVEEMERRYQLFAHTGVRDIARFNKMVSDKGQPAQHLPHILIVIDELADLMMVAPSDVEEAICRIAQKARACGIHLIIATQRPSVDVITGLIKSNIPTRIAFSVSSQVDSRTILDSQGAERLLGKGDMLYLGNGMSAPARIQGTFVTDEEIEDVIAHVRKQGEPEYIFKEEELIRHSHAAEEQDDLFEEACRFIITQGSASTSLLQRHFRIGYNRAARLMDMIEEQGVISVQNGSKPRTVLMTKEDMEEVFQ